MISRCIVALILRRRLHSPRWAKRPIWRKHNVGKANTSAGWRRGLGHGLEQSECQCAERVYDHLVVIQGRRASGHEDGGKQQAESELRRRERVSGAVLGKSPG